MSEVNPKRRNIIWTSILVVVVLSLVVWSVMLLNKSIPKSTPPPPPVVVVADALPLPPTLLKCSDEIVKCRAFAVSFGADASPCDTISADCLK